LDPRLYPESQHSEISPSKKKEIIEEEDENSEDFEDL
jgi:hypothetical protein